MAEKNVLKELTDALDKCGIENFELDATHKVLTIQYKEDFDIFYQELKAEPRLPKPEYGEPYHADKIASFNYEGWQVQGWITIHKPAHQDSKSKS